MDIIIIHSKNSDPFFCDPETHPIPSAATGSHGLLLLVGSSRTELPWVGTSKSESRDPLVAAEGLHNSKLHRNLGRRPKLVIPNPI